MFEKLLSVLPYNPSLVHQMSFYSRRMREEATIRRIGLIFLVLTFMIQFFAVLSPPQLTLADNNTNDMIDPDSSGFALSSAHPRTDVYDACHHNVRGFGEALATFGVDCSLFLTEATSHVTNVDSSSSNDNGSLYSMGYHNYGPTNPTTGRSTDQHTFTVAGSGRQIFSRRLDSFGHKVYVHSVWVTSSTGQTIYILSTCGNLVTFGLPIPAPPPPPAPTVTQTVIAQTQAPVAPPSTPATPSTPSTPPPPPCQYNSSIPATSPQCFQPCKYDNLLAASNSQCKPCDSSLSSEDTLACVTIRKTATNVTESIANADGTTAQPGDTITYTLYAQNKGKGKVKQFSFTEDMSDVLDYADITDLHSGTMNNDKTVTWPVESIDANSTITHQITVKVKNPIPATPVDPTDSMRFDLTMTNVYGNAINIKVPSPPIKSVQTTAAALPNTGPGTSLFIAASIMMVAGYFYARARLLARESELAIKETTYP